MAYVSMKNVKKLYTQGEDDVHALDGINVEIEKGEFIAILGPSGSGKSTLLNVLGGLDVPSSGEIYVDGRKINELNENQLAEYRRKTIGFVFQSFNLLPALTIEENIIMPILMEQKKVSMEFVKELMKVLEIDNLGKRMPSQISGGQQQRVAIARALANEPQMILADEPTGNLDTEISTKVVSLLVDTCKKYQKTLIMITHNEEIAAYADRIIRIKDGRVEKENCLY
ncbi:MAG: ABC transporter ATP-binding protein [Lachnospiraceae bacterium]|nr:ABC transporter ATP-binding protein [Lachnospiraceae bacterium]